MLKALALLTATLLVVLAVGFIWLYAAIERQAYVDEARPAEAIVVLGAAVWGKGPSPVLRARLEHAVALYQRGLAPVLILTGGRSEAEVMARLAEERGVPREAMILETEARSTQESVRLTGRIMRERGIGSIIVVSSPFHMKRALRMYRDAGFVAYGSPAANDPAQADPVLRVRYTLRECAAFIAYLLFGR